MRQEALGAVGKSELVRKFWSIIEVTGANYIIATDRPWGRKLWERLRNDYGDSLFLIERREDLVAERLASLAPRYIFFPHWSYKVDRSIYERYECVIFHMTDVPYGRGGSPLQNLIVRGHEETALSALRCVEEMDAGPVFMKRRLSLIGTAEEIFLRAARVMEGMVKDIIEREPKPEPQVGGSTIFCRRQPEDGDISGLTCLDKVYDFIRMLDADGYPPAYIEVNGFRYEFRRATRRTNGVEADVFIKKIDGGA